MGSTYKITPHDFDVLVAESRARDVDPRGPAIVLLIESAGFDPTSAGPGAKGEYNGLNQMSVANLRGEGITPEQWRAMSAAEQLPVIFRWWDGVAKRFNKGRFPADGARLLAMNFVPSIYLASGAVEDDNAVIVSRGERNYDKNTYYDPAGTGAITIATIRDRQTRDARGPRWLELTNGILAALQRADAPPSPDGPPSPPDAPPSPPAPAPPPLAATPRSSRAKGIGLAMVAVASVYAAAKSCGKVP